MLFLQTVSGDKGDTCVQCEGTITPGLRGPPGPKGDTGELNVVTFKFEVYFFKKNGHVQSPKSVAPDYHKESLSESAESADSFGNVKSQKQQE